MVGTQEIFLKAYPDLDPEGRIDAVPAATVETLKVKYKAMNQVDELLKAFRDNDRAIPRQLALQSVSGYLCAEGGGGREVVANRAAIGPWEKFSVVYLGGGKVALRAANGQFVCAEQSSPIRQVVANRSAIGPWEMFVRVLN
jgi:hypothetical protein